MKNLKNTLQFGLSVACLSLTACGGSSSSQTSNQSSNALTDQGHLAIAYGTNEISGTSLNNDFTKEYDLGQFNQGTWDVFVSSEVTSCNNSNSPQAKFEIVNGSRVYDITQGESPEIILVQGAYLRLTYLHVQGCSVDLKFSVGFNQSEANSTPTPIPVPDPTATPVPTPAPTATPEPNWIKNAYLPTLPSDNPTLYSCLQNKIQAAIAPLNLGQFRGFDDVSWLTNGGEMADFSSLTLQFHTDVTKNHNPLFAGYALRLDVKEQNQIAVGWDSLTQKNAKGDSAFKAFVGRDLNPTAEIVMMGMDMRILRDMRVSIDLNSCSPYLNQPIGGSSNSTQIGNMMIPAGFNLSVKSDNPKNDVPSCLSHAIQQASGNQSIQIQGFFVKDGDTNNSKLTLVAMDQNGTDYLLSIDGNWYDYSGAYFATYGNRIANFYQTVGSDFSAGSRLFAVDLSACENLLSQKLF